MDEKVIGSIIFVVIIVVWIISRTVESYLFKAQQRNSKNDAEIVEQLKLLAKLCANLPSGDPDRIKFINLKNKMIRRGIVGAIDIELETQQDEKQS